MRPTLVGWGGTTGGPAVPGGSLSSTGRPFRNGQETVALPPGSEDPPSPAHERDRGGGSPRQPLSGLQRGQAAGGGEAVRGEDAKARRHGRPVPFRGSCARGAGGFLRRPADPDRVRRLDRLDGGEPLPRRSLRAPEEAAGGIPVPRQTGPPRGGGRRF